MSDLQDVTKISGHFISICSTLQQFMNVKKMKFIFIINSVNTYNLGKCAYNYINILLIIIQLHTIIIQNDIGGEIFILQPKMLFILHITGIWSSKIKFYIHFFRLK